MNAIWTRRAMGCSSSVCVIAKFPQTESRRAPGEPQPRGSVDCGDSGADARAGSPRRAAAHQRGRDLREKPTSARPRVGAGGPRSHPSRAREARERDRASRASARAVRKCGRDLGRCPRPWSPAIGGRPSPARHPEPSRQRLVRTDRSRARSGAHRRAGRHQSRGCRPPLRFPPHRKHPPTPRVCEARRPLPSRTRATRK
jgi:hypothetical protein